MSAGDGSGLTLDRDGSRRGRGIGSVVLVAGLGVTLALVLSPWWSRADDDVAEQPPDPRPGDVPADLAAGPPPCRGLHQTLRRVNPAMDPRMPPLVGLDRRGDHGVAVYASARDWLICHVRATRQGWVGTAGTGGRFDAEGPRPFDPAGDALTIEAVSFAEASGTVLTAVMGRRSPEAARVVLRLEDGTAVTASTFDRLYAATWPSGTRLRSATAFDTDGVELATVRPGDGAVGSITR